MNNLNIFINNLERSVDHYGKESVGAEEILELAQAVKDAFEEITPNVN